MAIGERIRELRRDQNMTQIQLAEKAGIAVNTLRQYEGGKSSPRQKQLERLANALNVLPTDITGDTSLPPPKRGNNPSSSIRSGQFYPTRDGYSIFAMMREDGTVYVHPNFTLPQPNEIPWHLSEEDAMDITNIVQVHSEKANKDWFSPEVGAGIVLMLEKMKQKAMRLLAGASEET